MTSDQIMIAITAVYCIATILICVFNYRSAREIRDQTREQRRQFTETNRAVVDLTLVSVRGGLLCLQVRNTGRKIARNVQIKINKEFNDSLENEYLKNAFMNMQDSKFNLGIGEKWLSAIGTSSITSRLSPQMTATVKYDGEDGEYESRTIMDLSSYRWMLIYDSNEDEIRMHLKEMAEAVKEISRKHK
jgi:hypothetical protein